jgi:hypothetical protein
MTKLEAIKTVVKKVAKELNCGLIEAASKMQATALKNNNESLIADLHEFKMSELGL